ncbi:MAG: STAS domain-containing protein [Armatimonadota bacterium]|nr:STAS domain-containing protein [Armatimonadota bacterium]
MKNANLKTSVENVSEVPVLKVAGEIDLYTSPDFKSAIISIIDSGAKDIIIDLTDVSYMDSGGFGVLLGAVRKVKPLGGSINLVGCGENIRRILSITRLDTIFKLFESVDEAVKAIKG